MKKIRLIFPVCFLLAFAVFGQKANFPSMQGYWYSPTTKQLFVINTDKDASVKGRGVLYSNGNARFTEMQIMTQTQKVSEGGQGVYFLKVYDRAKDKMVYDLTSRLEGDDTIIEMTESGKREKVIYLYNLKNIEPKNRIKGDE